MDISNPHLICMGCMEPLSQPGGFCTRCGFNNSNNNHAHQLPIFTLLNGKYMVGRALGEGGFGITYIGIDIHLDVKIIIKEFYQPSCASRDSANGGTVYPCESGELFSAQLEKFMNDAKLFSKLADGRGTGRVRDFFRANGTAYIVMEYVEGAVHNDDLMAELYTPATVPVASPAPAAAETAALQGGEAKAKRREKRPTPQKAKKPLIIAGIATIGAAVIVAATLMLMSSSRKNAYSQALSLITSGDYDAAAAKLDGLPADYEDAELLKSYTNGAKLLKASDFEGAKVIFLSLGKYRDSADKTVECDYLHAKALIASGETELAEALLTALGDYRDCAELLSESIYGSAVKLMNEKQYSQAKAKFKSLGDYSNSKELMSECDYLSAVALMNAQKYAEAYKAFIKLKDYKDSSGLAFEAMDKNLSALLNDAAKFYEQITVFSSDDAKGAAEFAKNHAADVYNIASGFIGTASFDKASKIFALLGDYEDSSELSELCKACSVSETYSEDIKLLEPKSQNEGVRALFIRKEYIKRFLEDKWQKDGKVIFSMEYRDKSYNANYNKNYVKLPSDSKNTFYGVRKDGSGIFYTYENGGGNEKNWLRFTVIDYDHIELYVFTTDKTYSLARK